MIWSRASRRVCGEPLVLATSAPASERWASASRCSRPREPGRARRLSRRRRSETSASRKPDLARELVGAATAPSWTRRLMSTSAPPPVRFDPTREHRDGRAHLAVLVTIWTRSRLRWSHRNSESERAVGRPVQSVERLLGGSSTARRRDAGRCSRGRRRPGAGRRCFSGGRSPGAIRRAVTRKAVWPIILWPGRTARPSTCQSRTSVSQACGSVKPPCARRSRRTGTAGSWWRRTRRRCRRARSASATASRHSQGASMSRMTRSTRSPDAGQRLGEVADGAAARPGGSRRRARRRTASTLRAGDVGELLAPLVRRHPAVRADRAQQRAGQRAGADAGLDHVRARGRCRPSRRSGRRPWGRRPRRRAASRPRTRRAAAGRRGTRRRPTR